MKRRGRFHYWCVLATVCAAAVLAAPPEPQGRDLTITRTPAVAISQLPTGQKRWALIIGIDQYDDRQVTPLRGAANDASALADAFVAYAGFPRDQVILLASDQPAERRPTLGNILVRLSNLTRLVPKDGLLLIAFAGHGVERDGHAFLLPSDAKMADNIRVLQATALSLDSLKDWIREIGVKQVLMLIDACRNDPTAGRGDEPNLMTKDFHQNFNFDARNKDVVAFATIYATAVGQRAYEYSEKRHGYFTWAIVEALKGGAANPKGEVTLQSMVNFVQETVPRRIAIDLGTGKDQRPFADIQGYKANELIVAKVDPRGSQPPAVSQAAPDPRVMQLDEWKRIAEVRDPAAFEDYLKRWPDSPFAEQARMRIEEIAWDAVKETHDRSALSAFQQKYAGGTFASLAQAEIDKLDRADSSRKGILQALENYREAFQAGSPEGIRRVWPSLTKREVSLYEDFFKFAKEIRIDLEIQGEPEIQEGNASVRCKRKRSFVDSRGQQNPPPDMVVIKLKKSAETWVIDSIT